MLHIPALIEDLGLILGAAALVTLLFKKLKQPVVLGYLIAGILVGQHVPFFPSLKDPENIRVWGEIGVIFLLFSLGLEFSFKKLAAVGRPAAITAIFEIVFMLGVGFLVGQIFDWSKMDSLFLGGILAISSTTIIVRAFQELRFKGRRFVGLVFGVLVVEDLIAILLLVLLSTIAVTKTLSGVDLFVSTVRLGFFLLLWFIMGIYLLPIFLEKIRSLLDDETTLILAVGLCLFMVALATRVGFSPALGAFVMGSILAETKEGKRIEHLLFPVRDLFAAVFFVSVGMLIDPDVLYKYFNIILVITFVTILGKFISSSLGSLIAGKDFKQSIQTGLSLSQIGEFSFIIATLGLSLKVTSDFLYPIAVAVSAVTTFTTPYLIKYSDPISNWIEKKLPSTVAQRLKKYESALSVRSNGSVLSLLWQEYGVKMLLNSVIMIALAFGISNYGIPFLAERFPGNQWIPFVSCIFTLIISTPFLWAVIIGGPTHASTIEASELWRLERLQFGVSILRTIYGLFITAVVVGRFFPIENFAALLLITLSVLGIFFSRYAEVLYKSVEKRFLANLNENSESQGSEHQAFPELAPWDAVLAEFTVSPHSKYIGKTLMDAKLKERYGVMVTMIERGTKKILAPGRHEILFPYDKLYLIGSDEQLASASASLEKSPPLEEESPFESFGLESVLLNEKSEYLGKPIRNCGIREAVNGIIVGIERNGERILNPASDMHLSSGDLVWLVGNRFQIRRLRNN